ncbi:MAG: Wadjet anti-phage system protein JetD domain-containing protein, partial [Paratractidigestivibacter faecalis]
AAQTDAVANEPQAEALLAEKGDAAEAVIELAEEPAAESAATEPAAAEPADAPAAEATAESAADEQSNGRSGGRARVRGRGRRGLERRSRGDNLSDVPYVRRGGESETALREQIVQLDPRLWMNGWLLSHPGAFTLYERELRGIDAALREGELPGDLTRRQLAYKMGGNEKFFEYGADGHKLLRAMGADDLIGHRLVPKADMLYHVPRRRKSMKILVTENLDPWLDVRDLMYEDGRSLILGERVHGVVLGGGNPVIENNRLSGLLETLGAETIEVLYWGDIDRAGLNLLQRLQAMLEGRYKVTPFMPAYRLMLERAMERYPDPDQNERTTQDNVEVQDFSSMLEGLSGEQAAYFSSIIQKCGLIPQEILTKQDL